MAEIRTIDSSGSGISGGVTKTVAEIKAKQDAQEKTLKLVILLVTSVLCFFVLNLFLVGKDLFMDRSTSEKLIDLSFKIGNEINAINKEIIEQRAILDCLDTDRYWEYPKCFK